MISCVCGSQVKNLRPHLKTKKHVHYETEMHRILFESKLHRDNLEKLLELDEFDNLEDKLDCIKMISDTDFLEQQIIIGERMN
jgi:hypothetical protein